MTMPEGQPVACTLSADDLKSRAEAWRTVMATALQRAVATPTGVRLQFAAVAETDHALLDLVAAERACCGWASWTLTSTSESTVVEAAASGSGVDVLHAMFEATP